MKAKPLKMHYIILLQNYYHKVGKMSPKLALMRQIPTNISQNSMDIFTIHTEN